MAISTLNIVNLSRIATGGRNSTREPRGCVNILSADTCSAYQNMYTVLRHQRVATAPPFCCTRCPHSEGWGGSPQNDPFVAEYGIISRPRKSHRSGFELRIFRFSAVHADAKM